jgi:UDP-N-acetyl-D-glucosamine dehydrogenase
VRLPQGIPRQLRHRAGRHGRPGEIDRTIGEKIRPDCLVLIETTVAPGTTEYVAYPIIKKAFEKRGIASEPAAGPQLRARHAGPQLRGEHPRLLARLQRLTPEARERVVKFLSEVLNVESSR